MDMLGILPVRFHFDGEFINDGDKLHYFGGSEGMSYIDQDKVSLPELVGHLKDHCVVLDGSLLHWNVPGKDLKSGLRAMVDDKACLEMAESTDEGCVAEVYVEAPTTQDMAEDDGSQSESEDSDYENEMGLEEESEDDADMEEDALNEDVDMGAGQGKVAVL